MSDILSHDHPTLTSAADIGGICTPLFNKYNLNYFQFLKVYKDGSIICLSNQAGWIKFAIEYTLQNKLPAVYSCLKTEVLDPNNYFFLWDHNLPTLPVSLARNGFNIANGITFVERFEDCYYMIAFATPVENHGAVDFYLNHLNVLRNFIAYFRDEKSEMIQKAETRKIHLPQYSQDCNKDIMLATAQNQSRISVFFQGKQSYITQQEQLCLQQLSLGKSSKHIAKELNISHRTVETYFQRIKQRTECQSKSDLISLIE